MVLLVVLPRDGSQSICFGQNVIDTVRDYSDG